MFDIGFWEIAVIVVVALLVVGPEEFPALVRTTGAWIGKLRRFMSDTKNELNREFSKAEELKKLLDKEARIAELHEQIDVSKPAVPVTQTPDKTLQQQGDAVNSVDQPASSSKPHNGASD